MLVGTAKAMEAVAGQCLRKRLCQLKKPTGGAGSSLRAFLLPEIIQELFSLQGESSLVASQPAMKERRVCAAFVPQPAAEGTLYITTLAEGLTEHSNRLSFIQSLHYSGKSRVSPHKHSLTQTSCPPTCQRGATNIPSVPAHGM